MGEAFVLVHGFAGDRSSMELLKEHFEIRGNFVYSVQLSGHGTVWEDLKSVSRFEWYRDVQEAVRKAADFGSVHIVGLSMGGALSLYAASLSESIEKVSLINPALQLQNRLLCFLPIIKKFVPSIPNSARQVLDPSVTYHGYPRIPLSAVSELTNVWKDVDCRLPFVSQPTLIFRSVSDGQQGYLSSRKVFDAVSSDFVKEILLHRSGHVATLDYESKYICSEIEKFSAGGYFHQDSS